MPQPFEEKLARELVDRGILRADQVQVAREEQRQTGVGFEAACLRLGLVPSATMKHLLAELTGIPYASLEAAAEGSPEAAEWAPFERGHRFLILRHQGFRFDVALEDPLDVAH